MMKRPRRLFIHPFLWVFLFWLPVQGFGADPVPAKSGLNLTSQERSWLNDHPVIRVHNEQDWPPFNFFEFGEPKGLSIDYMNLLAQRLGIRVEYVTGRAGMILWG